MFVDIFMLLVFTESLNRQLMSTVLSHSDPVMEEEIPWSEAFSSLPAEDIQRLQLKEHIISQ